MEKMHRSAAPAAAAVELTEHLRHQAAWIDAAGQRLAVLAIGGDDSVFGRQRLHDADGHRLFAIVKMQKAENFLGLIELHAFGLEAPDAEHRLQQMPQMVVIEMHFACHRSSLSSVDRSPSGRPSSRAL